MANSKLVTMPKLPPPPRSAQSRSGFSLSLAWIRRPSAATTSAAMRLSQARPWRPRSQPMPPESVRPTTPVAEIKPPGVARPKGVVAASTSSQVAPPLDKGMVKVRANAHAVHKRQIDHQPAVADGIARHVVAAAADGNSKPLFAGVANRGHHIGSIAAAGD